MSFYIRIWQACDVEGIKQHLLIVGDLTADCAACRELGINYQSARNCPKCGTEFMFITARGAGAGNSDRGGTVKRIKERCPGLTFIDYDDYKHISGKQSAHDFFK